MRVNISKSKFFAEQIEYTWDTGLPDKLLNLYITRLRQSLILRRPKQEKNIQLCQFIGIVKYYCDMWFRRSDLLAPLTSLTSSKVKFEWHSSHQQSFEKIKKVFGSELLLFYPDFNKSDSSHLYSDASDHQ
jgi:hypothetical protein